MTVIYESTNPLFIAQFLAGYGNMANKQVVLQDGVWKIMEVAA